ncbi:MAG: hypothetical protein U0414_35985 [Polyangiaceae bacterium]
MIATWNIREFGKHPRRPESLVYIAEILRHFDLVSIVELRENLTELDRVLEILGPTWKALFTSPLFDDAGNRERAAYVFDAARVQHTGLASCPQAPRVKKGEEWISSIGWWRLPYLASFRPAARNEGATELLLLTAHVRWGARSSARDNELSLLADWVATDLAKDPFSAARDVLVLGDFNIPSFRSPVFVTSVRRIVEEMGGTAQVLVLKYLEQMNWEEVAANLGTSVSSARRAHDDALRLPTAALCPRTARLGECNPT